MRIDRTMIEDQRIYEVMYFSPIEVGHERYSTQEYFKTGVYARTQPASKVEEMSTQIDLLRHVECHILPFDQNFKAKHWDAIMSHCKMALAYLDAREARIAMLLSEQCIPATLSSESWVVQDPGADFDFLRITSLTVLALAARRVKFYQKAVEALTEARDICLRDQQQRVPRLLTALTLLNLAAVLGDIDHDEQALRWGLEALSLMYSLFAAEPLPEKVQAYYLVLACHNAALSNMRLGKWEGAIELVDEGIKHSKVLGADDDGMRQKLIAIGAQAKHVPEGFLQEAVNVANGWGEEQEVWKLSFWDFGTNEIVEATSVLNTTTTLKKVVIEDHDPDRCYDEPGFDELLARFIFATVSCPSLEILTIAGIDFNLRMIWSRIKKKSLIETTGYSGSYLRGGAAGEQTMPELANYRELLKDTNQLSRKLILLLAMLGNVTVGADLSLNAIGTRSIKALVVGLRWVHHLDWTCKVSNLVLQSNEIDAEGATALAGAWAPLEGAQEAPTRAGSPLATKAHQEPGVRALDVSSNGRIGDSGFERLLAGLKQFRDFTELRADEVGLHAPGCLAVEQLQATSLQVLSLSGNELGSEGAESICRAAMSIRSLQSLALERCSIDGQAAQAFARVLREHGTLASLWLSGNALGDDGAVEVCEGAAESTSLMSMHLGEIGITGEAAAVSIGKMMRQCTSLRELKLSGNQRLAETAASLPHLGRSIGSSRVLSLYLEDMAFTTEAVDEFFEHGQAEAQELQVLALAKNPIGDQGLSIVAECVSMGLTRISLSRCALTPGCQAALLNLVSLSPNLQVLDLSHNDLGPHACSDMVTWVRQSEKENLSLRSLELAHCSLGDDGLWRLLPILSAIDDLDVKGNGITSAGLRKVVTSNKFLIQLKSLNLADNEIDEGGLDALAERLKSEHTKRLWNPVQYTSSIDKVILTNNKISPSLAASTDAFLKLYSPLSAVVW